MKVNHLTQGIMVCLDAILDTRHGTLKQRYPDAFKRLRNAPKYYLRKADSWKDLDPDINPISMNLWYQGRDVETIKNSQLTMITRVIVDLISELLLKIKGNDPDVAAFFFVINIYPYQLSVDLVTEIASKFLTQLGVPDAPIGFVNKPWKQLGPEFLKAENIRYWYCYHYNEWLRENFEPINGQNPSASDRVNGVPEVKMIAPMLVQDQEGIDQLFDDLEEKVFIDSFKITQVVFSNVITFDFLPVSSFSTIDVEKLVQLERNVNMEKSEILSMPQTAVKEVLTRQGRLPHPSINAVNNGLEEMERLIYELKISNTKPTINIFKKNLALLYIELMKTYGHTPFNSGEDIEQAINQMSLAVDTTEAEYLKTEAHWNSQGIRTIKQVVEVEGEEIYRCVDESTGYLLTPQFKPEITVKAADHVALESYFL